MRSRRCLALVMLGAAGILVPAFGKAPVKLSAVATVADLDAEARAKIDLLKQYTASPQAYADSKKHEIPRAAGVLACLGQALAEHPQRDKSRIGGASLRDLAIRIRDSKTLESARSLLETVPDALAGRIKSAEVEFPWNRLIRLHDLMEEVNARNSKLRRVVRRSRNPKVDSRHASTLAILALVIHEDTGDVTKPAEIKKWRRYSLDFQLNMTALSAAIKQQDKAKVKPLYLQGIKACTACHAKFRSE